MKLTPRSVKRGRERLRLSSVSFRERVHREGILPWTHNKPVRRATLLWVISVLLVGFLSILQIRALKPFYTQYVGQPGGTYTEGITGSITTINPILVESGANADAARLVFSGLTRYTPSGKIEGDLAKSWTVSPDGRVYTFNLRPRVTWQDGKPLTSADVAFTVSMIQNPDTRSPMASAWQGVVVTAPSPETVVISLPVRYDAFINSTDVGILPKHVLADVSAANLRVSDFNQAPLGSGPFSVDNFATESGSVTFKANPRYFRAKPMLDSIVLRVYPTQEALQSAFRKHQINGMSRAANSASTSYGSDVTLHKLSIPEEVALFMRTESKVLTDTKVRLAISAAIGRDEIIKSILHDQAEPLAVPALDNQLIAAASYSTLKKDTTLAKKLLDEAGWKLKNGEVRTKDGKQLKLSLVTAQTDDYEAVSERLTRQLAAVGIAVTTEIVDVSALQRSYIAPRKYDLLLYGLNAGVDLDPYPYWHSSQAKAPGLNVSQYSSTEADKALVSARSTTDSRVRQVRLKSFLAAWSADAPAAMLYTPKYLYVTQDDVKGVTEGQLVTAADRFYNVQNWTIRTKLVPRR